MNLPNFPIILFLIFLAEGIYTTAEHVFRGLYGGLFLPLPERFINIRAVSCIFLLLALYLAGSLIYKRDSQAPGRVIVRSHGPLWALALYLPYAADSFSADIGFLFLEHGLAAGIIFCLLKMICLLFFAIHLLKLRKAGETSGADSRLEKWTAAFLLLTAANMLLIPYRSLISSAASIGQLISLIGLVMTKRALK